MTRKEKDQRAHGRLKKKTWPTRRHQRIRSVYAKPPAQGPFEQLNTNGQRRVRRQRLADQMQQASEKPLTRRQRVSFLRSLLNLRKHRELGYPVLR